MCRPPGRKRNNCVSRSASASTSASRSCAGRASPCAKLRRGTGLSVKCVIRYLRSDRCPDWNPGRQVPTQLDAFVGPIDAWVQRGGTNAADLFRELTAQGFGGSYDAVCRYLARRLGSAGRPGPRVGPLSPPGAPAPPSARKLSFDFIRRPEARQAAVQARLEKVRSSAEPLREALDLAGEFAEMVRQRSAVPLTEWLGKAEAIACRRAAELRGQPPFGRGSGDGSVDRILEQWPGGGTGEQAESDQAKNVRPGGPALTASEGSEGRVGSAGSVKPRKKEDSTAPTLRENPNYMPITRRTMG